MSKTTTELKLLKYCVANLDLDQPDYFDSYYAAVPLCVFNSIFSINTKYEAVLNALERFCKEFELEVYASKKGKIPPIEEQYSVSKIYNLIKDIPSAKLASDIFKNRQRTSPTNGILKADASVRFLKILKDFGIEYFQDIPRIINNETFDECVKRIPGQRSGIALKYFFMLTGSKDQIKPDRMILGFIKNATGNKVSASEALKYIQNVVKELKAAGYKISSPRHLDNIIWNYQRFQ